MPQVKLLGIEPTLSDNDVVESIWKQNNPKIPLEDFKKATRVNHCQKKDSENENIVRNCTPRDWGCLIGAGKVNIAWKRVTVGTTQTFSDATTARCLDTGPVTASRKKTPAPSVLTITKPKTVRFLRLVARTARPTTPTRPKNMTPVTIPRTSNAQSIYAQGIGRINE